MNCDFALGKWFCFWNYVQKMARQTKIRSNLLKQFHSSKIISKQQTFALRANVCMGVRARAYYVWFVRWEERKSINIKMLVDEIYRSLFVLCALLKLFKENISGKISVSKSFFCFYFVYFSEAKKMRLCKICIRVIWWRKSFWIVKFEIQIKQIGAKWT